MSRTSSKYGGKGSRKRVLYYFEDIIVDLELATIEVLGKKKALDLWYEVGFDSGIRYALFGDKKGISLNKFPYILDFIIKSLQSAGASACDNYQYDEKKSILRTWGYDSVVSRKTGNEALFAGILDGIFSMLLRLKVKTKYKVEKGKSILETCIYTNRPFRPELSELELTKELSSLNFPRIEYNFQLKTISTKKLIYFKAIDVSHSGKFVLKNFTLIPGEIGIFGIAAMHLRKRGLSDLCKKQITSKAESIADGLFSDLNSVSKKVDYSRAIFSATGCGLLNVTEQKGIITAKIRYPPRTRYECPYLRYLLTGFLQNIYNGIRSMSFNDDVLSNQLILKFKKL
ncbi:hypothetical protein J4212_00520 [Candidatus Woesearchaeota archaeon]|nr:hypothetical protein [Candidatus Woesearchaeota archaeon]